LKFDIKTDPKLFHHYIIGVGIYPATSGDKAGNYFMKYRPVYFTNDDVESLEHASMLSVDKLFKTSSSEAVACVGKTKLVNTLLAMRMSATANQCTLHHFSVEFEVDDEDLNNIVNAANYSNHYKYLLKESLIRG